MFQASPVSICRVHLIAPVWRSRAITASEVGAAGALYESPVAMYKERVTGSTVGACHNAAPEGPHNWAPAAFMCLRDGASAIVKVLQTTSPVAASRATTLPRNVQHS